MKKDYRFILLLLIILFNCLFAGQYLQISSTQVGPGAFHKEFIVPMVPWRLDVLEIDLTNPDIAVKSVKALDKKVGREQPSSMVDRIEKSDQKVIGAVNGDFFATGGVPCNPQVSDGEVVLSDLYQTWSCISFDMDKNPMISIPSFSGHIISESGIKDEISGVNIKRRTNYMVLYNSYMGHNTGTNKYGIEFSLAPIENWIANDTVSCIVGPYEKRKGSMDINPGKVVISGHGTAEDFLLTKLRKDDTVDVVLNFQPGPDSLTQLMGGFPKIVHEGKNYAVQGFEEEGGPPHTFQRFARTAAGYSRDQSTLYIVTVDGDGERYGDCTPSKGMTLIELADFMIHIGVYEGLNFDGGGSSTMIVRGKIENSARSCGETYVASSFMALSSASAGQLAHVQIKPDNYRIFEGKKIKFNLSGWDNNFNPVQLNKDSIEFSLSNDLGNLNTVGLFTGKVRGDSTHIVAKYGQLRDTARVYLKQLAGIKIRPPGATTNLIHPFNFDVDFVDEDSLKQKIDNADIEWNSLNPEIGVIDDKGEFSGKAEGQVKIVASYKNFSDTAQIEIVVKEGSQLIDSMEDLSNWSLSGNNIHLDKSSLNIVDSPSVQGNGALALEYEFLRKKATVNYAYLNTEIKISGVPDSITMDFNVDSSEYVAYATGADNSGEKFEKPFLKILDDSTGYEKVPALKYDSTLQYPLTINRIKFKLGYSAPNQEINQGKIYLDNLVAYYPGFTKIYCSDKNNYSNTKFKLFENYPNPFNSTTKITYKLDQKAKIKLEIYDLQGKQVKVLDKGYKSAGQHRVNFNAQKLSSGIYFYRLQSAQNSITRKCILLK